MVRAPSSSPWWGPLVQGSPPQPQPRLLDLGLSLTKLTTRCDCGCPEVVTSRNLP